MVCYYICPVCGYNRLEENPLEMSEEICLSCRFQFGYSFAEGYAFETWRKKWIEEGMRWSGIVVKPPTDWTPEIQLKNLEYYSNLD